MVKAIMERATRATDTTHNVFTTFFGLNIAQKLLEYIHDAFAHTQ